MTYYVSSGTLIPTHSLTPSTSTAYSRYLLFVGQCGDLMPGMDAITADDVMQLTNSNDTITLCIFVNKITFCSNSEYEKVKVKWPISQHRPLTADATYGCGAHLRFRGLKTAVS